MLKEHFHLVRDSPLNFRIKMSSRLYVYKTQTTILSDVKRGYGDRILSKFFILIISRLLLFYLYT